VFSLSQKFLGDTRDKSGGSGHWTWTGSGFGAKP